MGDFGPPWAAMPASCMDGLSDTADDIALSARMKNCRDGILSNQPIRHGKETTPSLVGPEIVSTRLHSSEEERLGPNEMVTGSNPVEGTKRYNIGVDVCSYGRQLALMTRMCTSTRVSAPGKAPLMSL